jgi:hypothetical protein
VLTHKRGVVRSVVHLSSGTKVWHRGRATFTVLPCAGGRKTVFEAVAGSPSADDWVAAIASTVAQLRSDGVAPLSLATVGGVAGGAASVPRRAPKPAARQRDRERGGGDVDVMSRRPADNGVEGGGDDDSDVDDNGVPARDVVGSGASIGRGGGGGAVIVASPNDRGSDGSLVRSGSARSFASSFSAGGSGRSATGPVEMEAHVAIYFSGKLRRKVPPMLFFKASVFELTGQSVRRVVPAVWSRALVAFHV